VVPGREAHLLEFRRASSLALPQAAPPHQASRIETQEGVNVPTRSAASSEYIATHVGTGEEPIAQEQWVERGIGTTDPLMKGSLA